ncbi:MAG: manganese catalase family protein [Gemmatimonadaceae bacterium]|nr:manganese catalase family protein [Gemmatimonadaceae bacterium]
MITRYDRIAVDLPRPAHPSANSAAAVQELLGGKYGEMSTLMNYTFQSFNFRGRTKLRPYYDLVANIAAEEFGHIEAVSYAINLLLTGTTPRDGDPENAALSGQKDARNVHHFVASGQAALPMDSMGHFWSGANVFSSGNLRLDLLHNFFLECGARANKIRVYEMVEDETARAMVGYLLVRGGVHVVAYAKALEELTGVAVGKLLPMPELSNKRFPHARKLEAEGLHAARRDLEGAAPRGRAPAHRRRRPARGLRDARPGGGAATHRAARPGHRRRDVQGRRDEAVRRRRHARERLGVKGGMIGGAGACTRAGRP